MSDISYNFHRAILRRNGEVIAEVHTSVDTDGSVPLFFLTVIDHYSASGKTDEERYAITFTRADAFRLAVWKLEHIDGGRGGQVEVPPHFPGEQPLPVMSVRPRSTVTLKKGRAHVG